MTRYATVLPSARRLMSSLRDIGYDLPSAIADLVDNSIDACAHTVEIELQEEAANSWVRVADDGLGMTRSELDEAMRYGSQRTYGREALGYFGLGLKTASLSQCRRLTVASRRAARGPIQVRRWDLDVVVERDSWDLEAPARTSCPAHLLEPLRGRPGTVVLWEKLDRILAFRNPSGAAATRALEAMAREIGSHLAMVFHRFLSGEATGGDPLTITVNGAPVEPWDPFARSEPKTRSLQTQLITLPIGEHSSTELEVHPHVLPAQTQFTSSAAHLLAGGPNRWNRQQGFYIYRRDRLVQSGGWNRLRTSDEHAKLARIAIDLPLGHEELFGINVAKMSVVLPEALRAPLRAIASAVVQEAQRSYRDHLAPAAAASGSSTPENGAVRANGRADGHSNGGRDASISGDWPLILRTVNEVLSDEPRRRDDLLLRLANAFD